jgi:hypothetical protein
MIFLPLKSSAPTSSRSCADAINPNESDRYLAGKRGTPHAQGACAPHFISESSSCISSGVCAHRQKFELRVAWGLCAHQRPRFGN